MSKPRKKFKVPHVFVLLTTVILICCMATWIIPSGHFERQTKQINGKERTLLVPGTFTPMEKHMSFNNFVLGEKVKGKASPVGIKGFLTAIPRGLEAAADIIFFIFIIGGAFGILQRTGVITATLESLMKKLDKQGPLLTVVLMLVMAVGGSTLGMGEEFIPLIPIFLIVSKKMGYDRVYAVAMVMIAAQLGFAASTTNPFTVNVAQGIAELPLNSGIPLRLVFFVCAITIGITYLLRYGRKIKANPANSYMKDDPFILEESETKVSRFSKQHFWIILVCGSIFAFIIYAVQAYGWWMADMAGGFFLMGLAAMFIARLTIDEAAKSFVKGMEEMVVAALVVGFARGISVVLADGQIMDTIVYGASSVLLEVPRYVAVVGMLCFESTLNLLIPSGSGQAAVTMPLMAPLSDILGITRQTAVLAFTCGDGFSNSIIPTSGVLMAVLSLAKVPYGTWLKFILPLFIQLMALSAVFLIYAVYTGYS
ncbi:MAG: C4-dicarboxylate ABC transporter permease [Acidobacteria bacterium]|nr:MAG: C4-dicarboxylate ABC transporter permease [Acidobacteriota bacterium]PIE89720.1 MAG: C4-dicarboxylate ABC transporter permease [Acidobacteriota bacterium]